MHTFDILHIFSHPILLDLADETLFNLKTNSYCEDKESESWCKDYVVLQCPSSCSQYDVTKFATKGILRMIFDPYQWYNKSYNIIL